VAGLLEEPAMRLAIAPRSSEGLAYRPPGRRPLPPPGCRHGPPARRPSATPARLRAAALGRCAPGLLRAGLVVEAVAGRCRSPGERRRSARGRGAREGRGSAPTRRGRLPRGGAAPLRGAAAVHRPFVRHYRRNETTAERLAPRRSCRAPLAGTGHPGVSRDGIY
jgi:hypothetical protein